MSKYYGVRVNSGDYHGTELVYIINEPIRIDDQWYTNGTQDYEVVSVEWSEYHRQYKIVEDAFLKVVILPCYDEQNKIDEEELLANEEDEEDENED